jgi:hypothetical protein
MSRRKVFHRHIGSGWGLTSPIKAGFTPLHRLKSSKTGSPDTARARTFVPADSTKFPHSRRPQHRLDLCPVRAPLRSLRLAPLPSSHGPALRTNQAEVRTARPRGPVTIARQIGFATAATWHEGCETSYAQWPIICSLPPHDLPQAQHKSRVPAVSKGRRPGN